MLKLTPKPHRAGKRVGLRKKTIISKASVLFGKTGVVQIATLAKTIGVVPATIKSHFPGGAPQILTEIAREAIAGVTRPYRPRDTPKEYMCEVFWRVLQSLSGRPLMARLVSIELSSNPMLNPYLAERILAFIEGLGGEAHFYPRGLSRVIGRLSDMILTECAQSNVARQEVVATQMDVTIDRLSSEEFPMLTGNAEALLNHVRTSASGPLKQEVAWEYAVETIEMLGSFVEQGKQSREPGDEQKLMESPTLSREITS